MAESLVKFSRKWVSSDCYLSGVTVKCFMLPKPSVWFGLVWFGLFVHPFSHTCNIGHISYILQFIYYNTTYKI
jgi:hypothetical protein